MKTLQQVQCMCVQCTGQGCNQQAADMGGAPGVCSWLLKKGAIRLQILEEGSFNEYFCPSKHTGNFHYE